jgi:hypothetical protein
MRTRARAVFETYTLRQRPDVEEQVNRLNGESWPTFLLHGDVTHWELLFEEFAGIRSLPDPSRATSPGLRFPGPGWAGRGRWR